MREQFNYTLLMQSKIKRVRINEAKWFSKKGNYNTNTFKVGSKTTSSLEKLFNKIATDTK